MCMILAASRSKLYTLYTVTNDSHYSYDLFLIYPWGLGGWMVRRIHIMAKTETEKQEATKRLSFFFDK